MKNSGNTLKLAMLTTALLLGSLSSVEVNAQNYQNGNSYNNNYSDNDNDGSYQDFYDDLSPYGEWISDPQYGYVWIPRDVDNNFRPYYTNGYWANTNYGNTWVSNYNWGWATFHYGRWSFDNNYGWIWIPGSEWGPAWVNWRQSNDGYYGWAPLGPGISIDNAFDNNYYAPDSWYVFAPQQYLYSNNFYNYVRAPRYNRDYLGRSSVVSMSQRRDGYRFIAGPNPTDIQRATGKQIPTYNISNTSRPSVTKLGSGQLNIYRPRIDAKSGNNFRPQQVQQGRVDIKSGNANGLQPFNPQRIQRNTDNRDRNNVQQASPRNIPRVNQGQMQDAKQNQQLQQQQLQQQQQQMQQQQRQVQQQQQQQQQQQMQQRQIQQQQIQQQQMQQQQQRQVQQQQQQQMQQQQRQQQQQQIQQQQQQRALPQAPQQAQPQRTQEQRIEQAQPAQQQQGQTRGRRR